MHIIVIENVDLFVRSWVEIQVGSWKNWVEKVDLFVRSWVEIVQSVKASIKVDGRPLREVVSWNYYKWHVYPLIQGRPLREVVSWNNPGPIRTRFQSVDLFVRSWVEIAKHFLLADLQPVDLFVRSWVEIWFGFPLRWKHWSRPLREVVSWNTIWGCILYSNFVDLFVRSWVEMTMISLQQHL